METPILQLLLENKFSLYFKVVCTLFDIKELNFIFRKNKGLKIRSNDEVPRMILCTCLKESSRDETTLERDRKADPCVLFMNSLGCHQVFM